MRNSLIVLGVLAYAIVVPWASMGYEAMWVPALVVSTMYFVLSLSVSGMALVAGIFMFIGVVTASSDPPDSTHNMALMGAILAMPFALLSADR